MTWERKGRTLYLKYKGRTVVVFKNIQHLLDEDGVPRLINMTVLDAPIEINCVCHRT